MKNLLILSCGMLLFFGCVGKKKQASIDSETPEKITADTITENSKHEMEPIARKIDGSYFKATGTEPFWGLKIYDDNVELQTMSDTIHVPNTEPIKVQDANISMYRIQTEATSMDIVISQKECTNAMSGVISPYTVTISYKSTGEGETMVYEGCGSYITDYRLHDIWVLEKMLGTVVSKNDFSGRDVPNMEININNNRFSGFSGCNRMTGSLFFEQGILRFTQVASTRMACPSMEKEAEFLTALQGSTTYKIENNRLYLSNGSEENLLVFKKID
ncbi:META domain-containing protein [Allomuricauda sp. F6463D]|uniref:META domain-containing protein n=1 Tax=Allomuricauda sp. F6463D TaxID=2926409 RepID=UPI001FF633D5|nr:META domain-containing protein [Muricauda sp. F6463D]MCK0161369.1 META domain-containing protein [Muricauda sp. F6463D]